MAGTEEDRKAWLGHAGWSSEITQALTKTDHAYQRIRRGILDGHFVPGVALEQERIARDLGLSTTPVREALRRLEAERLVTRHAHRDIVVAPLSLSLLEEVYAIRLSLDPLAASLASMRAAEQDREQMMKLALERKAKLDPMAALNRNRLLHRAIYGSCRNDLLVDMLDTLWDLSDRYRIITLHDGTVMRAAGEEHEAIVRAVVEGRPDEAAELMYEHTAESLQRIRESAR